MSDDAADVIDEEPGGDDAPIPSDADCVLGHLITFVNAQMPVVGGRHYNDAGQDMIPYEDDMNGRVFHARNRALIAAFDAIGRSAHAHEPRSDDAEN